MESRTKIIISISTAFLVSFSALTIFVYLYQPTYSERYKNFFSELDTKKNLVFLVGSSHVGQLNATLINKVVSNHTGNYVVYNIADNLDTPKIRLRTLQYLLDTKPTLVLYGISYRDFPSDNGLNSFLPDPSTSIRDFLNLGNYDTYLEKFSEPLLTTLKFIKGEMIKEGLATKDQEDVIPYTPFYYRPSPFTKILTDEELQHDARLDPYLKELYISPPPKNEQLTDFKKIIEELNKNNIKVIIFVTPLHHSYIDNLSNYQKQVFVEILNDIKNDSTTKIYDLSSKYTDLPIWTEPSHVAYNESSMIYSRDIAKIILDEMGP